MDDFGELDALEETRWLNRKKKLVGEVK